MALSFNGTTSKLVWSGQIAAAEPVSIFCWIKPTSAAASGFAVDSGKVGGANEVAIFVDGAGSGKVKTFINNGGSSGPASTTSVSTAWQPVLATIPGTASRKIYYAAGAVVEDLTVAGGFVVAHDVLCVGKRAITDTLYFAGDIAEVAIWSSTLSQANFDALAAGAAPSTISPGTIIDYWSLATQAASHTGVNGRVLTATSTTQAGTHPISTPDFTGPTLTSPTATATGLTTATGSVTTNESTGTLYRLASTNATESVATVKAAALTQAVSAIGAQAFSFTGLTSGLTYYAHSVHTDAAANDSARVTSASFTTLTAATALLAAGAAVGPVSAPSGTITITANGALAASKTVTASDGAGGSFTFAGGTTLTNGGSVTCTYTPSSAGAKTLTFSVSDASLTPVAHPFTASTTTYSMTVGPFGISTGSGPLLSTLLSYTVWAGVDTGAVSGAAINGTATTHATTGALVIAGLPAAGSYLVSLRNADASGRWHNLGTAA